jgi:hypothetical protein
MRAAGVRRAQARSLCFVQRVRFADLFDLFD